MICQGWGPAAGAGWWSPVVFLRALPSRRVLAFPACASNMRCNDDTSTHGAARCRPQAPRHPLAVGAAPLSRALSLSVCVSCTRSLARWRAALVCQTLRQHGSTERSLCRGSRPGRVLRLLSANATALPSARHVRDGTHILPARRCQAPWPRHWRREGSHY